MLGDRRLGLRRSYIPCWGSQLYPVGNGKRLKGVNQKSAKVRTGWGSLGSGEEGSAENVTMAMGGGMRCFSRHN